MLLLGLKPAKAKQAKQSASLAPQQESVQHLQAVLMKCPGFLSRSLHIPNQDPETGVT